MASIKDTVLQYVKNEYLETDDDREITYDTPLISGGIVDSFSMVSLKVFLEINYLFQSFQLHDPLHEELQGR